MEREAKNLAMLLLRGNDRCTSPDDQLAITDGVGQHTTGQDNPFLWTTVSRAEFLNLKIAGGAAMEKEVGMLVSREFKNVYGALPKVINSGKMPQQDSMGVARLTNMYTEEQCRRVVDGAIRAFFA